MSKPIVAYMILKSSIVLNWDSNTLTVNKGEADYDKALELIKTGKHNDIPATIDAKFAIAQAVPKGEFTIHRGRVFSKGERVHGYIGNKLYEFWEQGLPYQFLLNFYKRIQKNPSKNSAEQLYRFLESAQCPITEDGKFLAYKSVKIREDGTMWDHHSGRTQYVFDKPTTMKRDSVVDDPNHSCGAGLHVGSFSYAKGFSGNDIIEVLVDPADVVSVPKDSGSGKCRCCKVTPVAVCEKQYTQTVAVKDQGSKKDKVLADGTVEISRKPYKVIELTATGWEQLFSLNKKKKRATYAVRPSKAPKAIKTLSPKAITRVQYVNYVEYLVETGSKYLRLQPVNTKAKAKKAKKKAKAKK